LYVNRDRNGGPTGTCVWQFSRVTWTIHVPTKVLPSSQRSSPCATADKTPLCPDAVAAGAPYNRVLGNGTVYGKNFILAPTVPPAGIPQTPSNP
jgi:hypothetical protein